MARYAEEEDKREAAFVRHFRIVECEAAKDSSRQDFGSAAAAAGKVKKIVAARLQNKPMAQA